MLLNEFKEIILVNLNLQFFLEMFAKRHVGIPGFGSISRDS